MMKNSKMIWTVLVIMAVAAVGGLLFVRSQSSVTPDQNQPPTPSTNTSKQTIALKVGETALITGSNIQMKFVEVSSDSRCPIGATCIWAGEVSVVIGLTDSGKDQGNVTLTLPGNKVTAKSDSYTIGQYNIALQEVKPTHAVGTPLDPKAYTATFVVTHS